MSLRLTKPGLSVALRHPKTGALLEPIGHLKDGTAVWPVLGASSDDPDDPAYTGEGGSGGEDEDDDSDDDHTDDDDSEDDDSEDDDDDSGGKKKAVKKEPTRPERQAARYRTERNALRAELEELKAAKRRAEDAGKPEDEVMKRDLTEAQELAKHLTDQNVAMMAQLAFFKTPSGVDWADPMDAFALADREGLFDDVIDEDGNVDTRELRRGLRDLAKRKPHLVNKSRARDEDSDDDEEPSSSGSKMNGNRRGSKNNAPTREQLAKRFPVVGR